MPPGRYLFSVSSFSVPFAVTLSRVLSLFLLCVALESHGQSQDALHRFERASKLERADPAVSYQLYYGLTTAADPGSVFQRKCAARMATVATSSQLPESFRDKSYPVILSVLSQVDSIKSDSASGAFLLAAGKMYSAAYKIDSAVLFLTRARSVFYKLEPDGGLNEADACTELGDVYKYELYFFDKAEELYERALSIHEHIAPRDTRALTRLYYNLATTNRSQSDYESAVLWATKAIEGCEKMDDDRFLERTCSVIGNIYRDMQVYDSAIAYYEKGVAVNRRINNGNDNETLAGLYAGWGETYFLQERFDAAAERVGEAVRIYRRTGSQQKLLFLHYVRLLGDIEIKRGNFKKAQELLTSASRLANELGLTKGGPLSNIHMSWGDYHLATHSDDKAITSYQDALIAACIDFQPQHLEENPKIEQVELKGYAYDALLAKAEILTAMRPQNPTSLNAALDSYKLAEELMVKSRGELDTEDAKWNFVDANFSLYENMLSAMSDANADPEMFLRYLESSKSKTLADALQEAELKKTIGDDELFQKLRVMRQTTLTLQHQLNEKNDSLVRDELINAAHDISQLQDQIRVRYPSYFKTKSEGNAVSVQSIKDEMKTVNGTFIEYFWGSETVFAMVVTADTSWFTDLGRQSDIMPRLRPLTEFFATKKNDYSPDAVANFAKMSNDVYRFVLSPFESEFSNTQRLIIVPDGPLSQLPFETLVTKSSDGVSFRRLSYLVMDHDISYALSGSSVIGPEKRRSERPSVLGFGFTGGGSKDDINSTLAGTETELLDLSKKFPQGTYLYGADVTEGNFKRSASDFDVLHIAVHGSGDVSENYSAVLYFRDQDGVEDGKLHWYELYSMNLKASLAVLTACESGIGKSYRGEGMLSMANAFTFAGCNNLVMGLWKVDDQVSVKLMDTFYSKLLDGMAIDQALAIAKRTYLAGADQVSANPKLWASLVAYGESPVLTADKIHPVWVLVALGVLMTAIFFLIRKTKK